MSLPSRTTLAEICDDLLAITFPEAEKTNPKPDSLWADFVGQVYLSLATMTGGENHLERAENISSTFFAKLKETKAIIQTDIQAAYDGDPAASCLEEIILSYPSIKAVSIQRMAHILYENRVPLMPRMMTEWAHSKAGIDIHPGAAIGNHFFIDHGTGVVIGETCEIGDHVKLYHGVTLGALNMPRNRSGGIRRGEKRHPNIGNNVTIYPNSTILGGNTFIGDGSTIGAHVFLTQSVPKNSIVTVQKPNIQIQEKI